MRRVVFMLLLAAVPAQAQVRSSDALAGTIVGRVCRDANGDGVCSAGEEGLGRVRVVLETGQSVWTDAEGRFHLAAVDARTPQALRGVQLAQGRHRVKLDPRTLPPDVRPLRNGGETSVTLEVPMAAAVLHDFALVVRPVASSSPQAVAAPSGAELSDSTVRFPLVGRMSPGERIFVGGREAELLRGNRYRAWVELHPGPNDLTLLRGGADGRVELATERVDVVSREGSLLVIPREPEVHASLRLPAPLGQPLAAGPLLVPVEGEAGTRVVVGGHEHVVGPEGGTELPLDVDVGDGRWTIQVLRPGRLARTVEVPVRGKSEAFVVGLLDLEGSFGPGGLKLLGRGAAHAELRLGAWDLAGELSLADSDLPALSRTGPLAVLLPRRPDLPQRWLDPEEQPIAFGDASVGVVPNTAQGFLRLEARNRELGTVGFGSHREDFSSTEVGRFARESFGGYARLQLPSSSPVRAAVNAFAGPGLIDPTLGLAALPAHEELSGTGGSVYYLRHGALARGAESVRVEIREARGGAPLAERHLVRGRDYELDETAGRILLSEPLSFLAGASVLRSDPLVRAPEPVLVVDYAYLATGVLEPSSAGAELRAGVGPVDVGLRGARAAGGYQLAGANASATFGRLTAFAEFARSLGSAVRPEDFARSDDGGLSTFTPTGTAPSAGNAYGVRVKGPGFGPDGSFDVSYRTRAAGFSDESHADATFMREWLVRADQRFGPVRVSLLGDDFVGEDPRLPLSGVALHLRALGAGVSYRFRDLEVGLEAKDESLRARLNPYAPAMGDGGRTSVGATARYDLTPRWRLVASHQQRVASRGDGPGAEDDSFSAVGADYRIDERASVGGRVGWGPRLGPLAWLEGNYQRGADTFYGAYSVDTDGPSFGERRSVSGARTRVGDGSTVFVEDVTAQDANALRIARAVGLSQTVAEGLEVTARYEHGARNDPFVTSPLRRDAAGASFQLLRARFRVSARAELRWDKGTPVSGPPVAVDRVQRLASAALETQPLTGLTFAGRLNYSDTTNLSVVEARFLEGNAGLAYRAGPTYWLLRYAVTRELLPAPRTTPEQTLHVLSFMPSLELGTRVRVAGGVYAGRSIVPGSAAWIFAASLRPSVRVWEGLELAVEGARRSNSPDGGSLNALRAEVGYRIHPSAFLGVGVNVLGYQGLGVSTVADGTQERVYVRADVGF